MNNKLLSTITAFILTLTIALPAFASGISLKQNPSGKGSNSSVPAAKKPSYTAVLFTNTTPYEVAVTASGYRNDFGRHPEWLDERHQNPKAEDRRVIKPGGSAFLELSMLSHRKSYSFYYTVEFLGTGCNTMVHFESYKNPVAQLCTVKFGDNRQFQISECRKVTSSDKSYVEKLADDITYHMGIRPGTLWYKASVKTISAALAKVIKTDFATTYEYQVALSETETVTKLPGRSTGGSNSEEVRPVFWNDAPQGGTKATTGSGRIVSGSKITLGAKR